MDRPKFVETPHCTYNSRCKMCRDPQDKDKFRRSIANSFELPDDNLNFDCPHGVKWTGDAPPFEKVPLVVQEPPMGVQSLSSKSPSDQQKKSPCGCGKGIKLSATGAIQEFLPHIELASKIVRDQCPNCTRKHLAQAVILFQESINGHPEHHWMALAHLAEAESEIKTMFPDLGVRINGMWMTSINEQDFVPPDIIEVIEEITRRVVAGITGTNPEGVQVSASF